MRRLPQSIHDRAELLARSHPLNAVAEIVGLRPSTLTVMKRRHWRACDRDPRLRPIPNDWAIQARHMTHGELCAHYRAGNATVSRWMREKPARAPMKKPGRPKRVSIA